MSRVLEGQHWLTASATQAVMAALAATGGLVSLTLHRSSRVRG